VSTRELPSWVLPAGIFGGLFFFAAIVDTVIAIWGEARPVGSFAEEFLARLIYWAMLIGSFFGAVYAGLYATQRSCKAIVGWVSGIGAFILIGAIGTIIGMSIPGVSWRFERLLNSDQEIEY
jgi:hypothetical protein